MSDFLILVRAPTREECESNVWAPVSFEESAAIEMGGKLVAMSDEYGSIYLNPEAKFKDERKAKLLFEIALTDVLNLYELAVDHG